MCACMNLVCLCVGVCVCVLFVICVPSINDSSSSVSHALSARLSGESVVFCVPAYLLLDLKLGSHLPSCQRIRRGLRTAEKNSAVLHDP